MFPENLLRTPKVFINNGCSGDAASRTAHRWGEQLSTSLLRSHARILRRGERHIPNGFRSPGGSALSRTHGVLCKRCWTPYLMASPGRDSLFVEWLQRGGLLPARPLQTWIVRRIAIRHRLERVCTSARLFLLVVTTP